jgi:hypothetical protein
LFDQQGPFARSGTLSRNRHSDNPAADNGHLKMLAA